MRRLSLALGGLVLVVLTGCLPTDSLRRVSMPNEVAQGQQLLRKGDTVGATRSFDAAIHKDPSQPMIYLAISQSCESARQWDLAARYAEQGIRATPAEDKTARVQLYTLEGVAYTRLGDMTKALAAHQAAYNLEPDNPMMMNNLGYVLAEMPGGGQNLDEALRLTRTAVDRAAQSGANEEDLAVFLDSLGWVLYRKGTYDEAMATLERSVEMSPGTADIHYHLGMVYIKKDRRDDAVIELQRALRLDPSNEQAAEALRSLHALPPPAPGVSDEPLPQPL